LPRALAIAVTLLVAACGDTRRTWHPNGALRDEGRVDYRGRETGVWTFWYPVGEIRERGSYDAGRRAGPWTQWYVGGQRHSRGDRRWNAEAQASLREGPWTFWYSNGQLRGVGSFEAGRPVGEWTWWNHLGRLDEKRSGFYVEGVKREY
jgi:antitoxin component YwqK of YwqJK toxin-antitoxin module